ncbi:MAG: hypothetical protein AAB966_00370, partial [Patescibacteria group bacterium]
AIIYRTALIRSFYLKIIIKKKLFNKMDNLKIGDYYTSYDEDFEVERESDDIDVEITGTYGEEDWKVQIDDKIHHLGKMPIEADCKYNGVFEPGDDGSFLCEKSFLHLEHYIGPLKYILLNCISFYDIYRITEISRDTNGKIESITVSGTPRFNVTITVFYRSKTSTEPLCAKFATNVFYDVCYDRISCSDIRSLE